MSGKSVCELNCGNGRVQSPEECDDGNTVGGDGCSSCSIDEGFKCSEDGSGKSTCEQDFCRNGIYELAKGEQCDDGNEVDGDGCSNECIN